MAANHLVINDDKLHLVVFANKANSLEKENVSIKTGALTIKPSDHEKLLGCHISQSLKWNEHLIDNKESHINQLNRRLNGLSLVCKRANFKTRLMVANGIFSSKLVNLIQIWGGAQDYLLRALQVTQNKAARLVSGMGWYTPTSTLLRRVNWLSVKQLIAYHTILTVHRSIIHQRPQFIYEKICSNSSQYDTRHQTRFNENFSGKSERTRSTFCYRGVLSYQQIPLEISKIRSLQGFKLKLKRWIKVNVEVA